MKNFTIEPIIDAYLISGQVREEGGHGKTARNTLLDAKNLIFNRIGASTTATEVESPKEPESGWRPNLNFRVEELKNGYVLYQPGSGNTQEEKIYFATVNKLAAGIEELINQNINPEPQK